MKNYPRWPLRKAALLQRILPRAVEDEDGQGMAEYLVLSFAVIAVLLTVLSAAYYSALSEIVGRIMEIFANPGI